MELKGIEPTTLCLQIRQLTVQPVLTFTKLVAIVRFRSTGTACSEGAQPSNRYGWFRVNVVL